MGVVSMACRWRGWRAIDETDAQRAKQAHRRFTPSRRCIPRYQSRRADATKTISRETQPLSAHQRRVLVRQTPKIRQCGDRPSSAQPTRRLRRKMGVCDLPGHVNAFLDNVVAGTMTMRDQGPLGISQGSNQGREALTQHRSLHGGGAIPDFQGSAG